MRYLSLFSGVEAASAAWMPLGWEPVAFCEVDEFPAAVLAHRFPHVPNLGDVAKVDWSDFHGRYGAVDVLVGGSPCQSFSIAGSREGLQGESRLMFEYVRAVRDLVHASAGQSPRYVLWENVPGALSSEGGDAFGQLLAELDECGYGLAWRVLDAQFVRVPDGSPSGFFGPVAQRRRRVFLVGVLGSPHAAEILIERTCLRGDHPTGREARQALAGDADEGIAGGDRAGFSAGFCQGASITAGGIGYEEGLSATIRASESGTARTPAVLSFVGEHGGNTGLGLMEECSPAVSAKHAPQVVRTANTGANGCGVAVAFEQNQRGEVRLNAGDGSVAGALSSNPAQTKGQGASLVMTQYGDVAGTLNARSDSSPCADRGQNVVCMADGNARTAVDFGMSGSLKVGQAAADCALSNGGDVVGALCASDAKGVGSQYVNRGKVICQRTC